MMHSQTMSQSAFMRLQIHASESVEKLICLEIPSSLECIRVTNALKNWVFKLVCVYIMRGVQCTRLSFFFGYAFCLACLQQIHANKREKMHGAMNSDKKILGGSRNNTTEDNMSCDNRRLGTISGNISKTSYEAVFCYADIPCYTARSPLCMLGEECF